MEIGRETEIGLESDTDEDRIWDEEERESGGQGGEGGRGRGPG